MREIKFRGKRVDNGEWVYGYYFIEERDIEDGFIWRDIPQIQQRYGDHYQYFDVIPETIGQYTGLKDKNGVEIYEGDILLWGDDNRQNQVVFSQGSFQMQRYGGLAPLRYHNLINSEAMNAEVIGNICENPELLKE